MNKRFLLSVVISILILYLLFSQFLNFDKFLAALSSVSILLFLASDLPYLIQAVLMGYRLSWAMRRSGVEAGWKDGFFAHLFGMLGSDFSVGRTGYLLSSLPFKSKLAGNIGVVSALTVVDVIAKAIFGTLSAVFLIYLFGVSVNPILFLFSVAVILGGILFFTLIASQRSVKIVSKIPLLGKKLLPYYQDFRSSLESLKRSLLFLFIFPLLGWFLRGLEWNILGYAVGIFFPFHIWLMLHPILTLVRLIPVTVTGLGVFEATLILLFPDINPESLVVFGILDMINNSLVDAFGLLSLWKIRE